MMYVFSVWFRSWFQSSVLVISLRCFASVSKVWQVFGKCVESVDEFIFVLFEVIKKSGIIKLPHLASKAISADCASFRFFSASWLARYKSSREMLIPHISNEAGFPPRTSGPWP